MKPEVLLHVTNKCNLNCLHCYLDCGQEKPKELSFLEFKDLFKQLSKYGIKKVHIDGGEPLIRKDIFEIIDEMAKYNFNVDMDTNGTLINDEVLKRLKGKVHLISFSLDGATAKTHDWFRRKKGTFNLVLKNIKKANDQGFKIRIWYTVNKRNMKEALSLPGKLSRFKNFKMIGYFYCSLVGRALKNSKKLYIPTEEWIKFCEKAREKEKKFKRRIKIVYNLAFLPRDNFRGYVYDGCNSIQKKYCHINSQGKLFFCGLLMNTKYSLGDLRKKNFTEIWNHSPKWKFWNKYDDSIKKGCEGCEFVFKCRGGCKAYSYIVGKNLYTKDPRCTKEFVPLCIVWNKRKYISKRSYEV